MSKRAMLYVTTSSVEGREDEFDKWYDEVHIPEIFEHVKEIRAATRYRRAQGSPGGGDQAACCTVYEIEADDPAAAVAGLVAAGQAGKLHMTDAIAPDAQLFLWEEHRARVTSG